MIILNEWQNSAILAIIVLYIENVILFYKLEQYRKREFHKKHFCNHCKTAFLRIKELDKTHCDFCGRPLTLHINGTEDIKNIKAVLETKLRRKENIKPYTINFYKK